jgi:hypothetical protein
VGFGIPVAAETTDEDFDFATAVFSAQQPSRNDGCVVDNQNVSRPQETVQYMEPMMSQFSGLTVHYQNIGLIPAVNRLLGNQLSWKLVIIIG